jgi:hypothetical protein
MSEVMIVEVDAELAGRTHMHEGTRAVRVRIPTDRAVTISAVANAKKIQRAQVFDGAGRQHFEWEGRGEGRTLGTGSRTFADPILLFSCASFWGDNWVVSDLNVSHREEEGKVKVLIRCEDGGDFPGDWDDLKVGIEWSA